MKFIGLVVKEPDPAPVEKPKRGGKPKAETPKAEPPKTEEK